MKSLDVTLNAAKRAVFEAALEAGIVNMHFDGRAAGVDIPPSHRAQPALMFRIGHGLHPPTPLDIDALGVTAELLFGAATYVCRIPWSAVVAIKEELAGQILLVTPGITSVMISGDAPAPRPKLGLVPMPEE